MLDIKTVRSPAYSVVVFFLILACAGTVVADELPTDPLEAYIEQPDPSAHWQVRAKTRIQGVEVAELRLTSQTWKGITWKHQLYVLRPKEVHGDGSHALFIIDGGKWKEKLDQDVPDIAQLVRRANRYAGIVTQLRTPAIILRHVPYQPVFDGLTEDRAIAFTFERYLDTGDSEWPLLLPMVKSVVQAMDTVEEYSQQHWPTPVRSFTVAGGSKRGWTTWLTAATDVRVKALAPAVIDVLNMAPQIEYQQAVWGGMSEQIAPYTERDLHHRLTSESGRVLREIVDPYHYRERLTQPKLIVIGTNDRYWPVDALNLYWDELVGPKYVLYVPNNGHGIDDYDRVFGSLDALHRHIAAGEPLPQLEWWFTRADDRVRLFLRSSIEPTEVHAWVSRAEQRDFRDAEWLAEPFKREEDLFVYEMNVPQDGYRALFGEAVFGTRRSPYYLSTNLHVFGLDQ